MAEDIQARFQEIANEISEPHQRLLGDPKGTFLEVLNGGTGDRETNWHDSKKIKELQAERQALLLAHPLRTVN